GPWPRGALGLQRYWVELWCRDPDGAASGNRPADFVRRVERLRAVRRDVRPQGPRDVRRAGERRLRPLATHGRRAANAGGAPLLPVVRAAPVALPRPRA